MHKTVLAAKFTFLAALVACNGEPPTETGIDWPAAKPFQTVGDEGSVVVVRLDRPENPRLDAFAMFGDTMQGFDNAAACAQGFMPCIGGPRIPYGEVAFLSNSVFRPESTNFSWVGDELFAGPLVAGFSHDPEDSLAWYEAGGAQRPNGSVRLRLGGEWADLDANLGYYPPDFKVTAPILDVDQRLDLSGSPITFTWDSVGGREIWLWVEGDWSRRLIRVPDTGTYTLEPFSLGLAPAEKVEVGLTAVTTDSMDVDGNTLDLMVLTGAGWTGSVCGDFLDVPVDNRPPDDELMESPAFMGYAFNGIIDEGLRDFIDPDTGQPRSAEIYFDFYNENYETVCRITYDASEAARRPPLLIDSDATQYATFNVGLFNGNSTCGLIDPTFVGFSDLRNYLEQFDWSFSIADIVELEEPLRAQLGEDGWANQSPFMFSLIWSQDGLFGQERGYGYSTTTPVCYQGSNNAANLRPEDEIQDGYYFTFPYYIDRLP